MRTPRFRESRMLLAGGLSLLVLTLLSVNEPLRAGGPIAVLSDETLVRWFNFPIEYNTDGGPLGMRTNDEANTIVAEAYGVWEAVATSTVSTTRVGTGNLSVDGDVDSLTEFNDVGCVGVNPVVYDSDGTIVDALFGPGASDSLLGFAGPCSFSTTTGEIVGGRALLNGKGDDGSTGFRSKLQGTAVHEFGHELGLGHSIINFNCFSDPFTTCPVGSDDIHGVPTMFPVSLPTGEVAGEDFSNTLAPDDVAWISFLYPAPGFSTSTGRVEGKVLFGNGIDGVQGGNVIARRVDNPLTAEDESRRIAVSSVSGFLATARPGNATAGVAPNGRGSTDPARRGFYLIPGLPVSSPTDYTVTVESITEPSFVSGSSVGPLSASIGRGENIPLPGAAAPLAVTVDAGTLLTNQDIVLDDTLDRFDQFESATDRNDTVADASPLGGPGTFRASISPFTSSDVDFFAFNASFGTDVTIQVIARNLVVPVDVETASFLAAFLEIRDTAGTVQNTCDTDGDTLFDDPCFSSDPGDPSFDGNDPAPLVFRPPSTGTFVVGVSDLFGDSRPDFQYDIVISGNATANADLAVTKADNVDPVTVGNSVSYTITVTNNGPDPATNVTLTDTFSGAAVTITSVVPSQGTCDTPAGNPFNCNLGTIANGSSATVTITVTADAEGTITNTVAAAADESDPDATNNTNIVQTTQVVSVGACTINFDGGPSGTGTEWNVAENWDADRLPVAGDVACISGSFAVTLSSGTHEVETLLVTSSAVFTISGGTLTINSVGSSSIGAGGFTLRDNGTLTGPGTLNIAGLFTWAGGNLSGSGVTNANGGMNITAPGPLAHTLDGRTLNNAGVATVSNNTAIFLDNGSALNNLAGATLNLTGDPTFTFGGGTTPVFNNSGALSRTTSASTATFGAGITVTTSGTIEVQSGTLAFSGGLTQTAGTTRLNGGTLSFGAAMQLQGGLLEGANGSTITGDITQTGGTINPGLSPGILNLNGNFTQDVNGTLVFELGGLTPGTEHDQINAAGSAVVNGTINVVLINGFVPSPGDTFTLATAAGGGSGNPTLNLPALPPGLAWEEVDDPNTLTIRVISTEADLVVTKTDDADPVTVGSSVTYTVTVTNNGPADATGVSLADTFSGAAVTVNSIVPSQGSCDAPGTNPFTCTLGTIANSASAIVTITVTADAVGTITNTVSAVADQTDPDSTNNANIVETTTVNEPPAANADLAVTKTDSPDPVPAGGSVTYTITITNNGPDPATNVTLTDTFSGAAVTITSVVPSQGTCDNPAGNPFSCNLGVIASGANATVTVTVTANEAGTITNTISASADQNDSNPANNTNIQEQTTVTAQADLTVTKSDSPDPVAAGSTLTYTVTVTNNGPSTATGVTLTDTLPAGTTLVSSNPSAPTCTEAGGQITCNLGSLAPGANTVVTITVTAPATPGPITNTVSVTGTEPDPNPANNTDTEDTNVTAAADLSITKADSPDPVAAEGTLTYTLTVTNNGPTDATGVTVTDTLPAGTTFVSASPGCVHNSGVVTCNIGNLASGANTQLTITVTAPVTPGQITNTASVTGNEGDPNPENNSASEDTTVNPPQADLAVSKTDSPDPVTAGASLTYSVEVTNNGPNTATSVTITDTLPAGTTFVSASAGCVHNAGVVTCNVGNLANGASAQVTITVTAPAEGGLITNTASASSEVADPDTTNNSDSEDTTVTPQADLAVAKADSPDPVAAGSTLTYTVTVTNNGPSTATGITLTDTLPAGTTFVSASAGCTHNAGVVTCNVASLASGANTQFTITVTAPATPGPITNTVSVTGTEPDPNPANNTDTEDTNVTAAADLSITKADSPDPVAAEGTLTYTLTVTNNGPTDATGVTVTDTLPAGTTFVSASAGCTHNAGVVTCNVGNLANGANAQMTITVIAPAEGGSITNTASVTGNEGDPNPENNSDSEDTQVTPRADLAVTKTDAPDPVGAGESLAYTVTVTNNGPSTASGVTVVDTLPAGTTFVSASPGCAHNSGVVTCSVGNLASGANAQITITVNAPPDGGLITNTVTVSGNETDPVPENNSDSENTTVEPRADLEISKTDSADPVAINTTLTYTLTVRNNGPSAATGATVMDTLPGAVTFVSANPSQGNCNHAAGVVTCTLGSLANGATATITIQVTTPGTEQSLVNNVTVAGNETDPVPANNSAAETTQVVEIAFVAALNTMETFATATLGGSNPLPRGITVTATAIGTGTPANAAWQASTDVPWAVVQNSSGTTPAVIRIAINIAGLAVGTHQGTLTVSSPTGLFFPVQATITLVINPAPPGNVDTSQPSTTNRVDGLDLIRLALAFGSRPGDPNFNPAANLTDTDVNGNGVIDPDEIIIDGDDLAVLAANFGNTS